MVQGIGRIVIFTFIGILLVAAFFNAITIYPETEGIFQIGLIGLAIGMELLSCTPTRNCAIFPYLRFGLAVGMVIFVAIAINKVLLILSG